MKFFALLFFLSLTQLSFAKAVLYRPPSETLIKGSYEVDITGRYFSTLAYYDVNGNEVAMDEGADFTLMEGDLTVLYGFRDNIEIRGGVRGRQVTSTTATTEITEGGLESYWLGGKFSFKRTGKTSYALDFLFRNTSYTNTDYQVNETLPEEQVLGDSGSEYHVGAFITYYNSKTHFISAFAAYRQPGNNLSPEIPYDIQTMWAFKEWAMYGGVKGIYSMGGDEYSDNPTQKTRQTTGTTNLFNSIDRSFIQPYAGIRKAFKKFRVGFEFGRTISGTSTDQGYEVIGNIVWSSKGESKDKRKVESFKEYDIEATILKISPRGKFVKIDKGLAQDVEKGMKFDIYQSDYFGGNELVATGIVYEMGADWSIVKLVKKYSKAKIKAGFVARGYE